MSATATLLRCWLLLVCYRRPMARFRTSEQLEAAITKLLRAMNSDPARAKAVTSVTEGPRWSEGARTDEYLQRRAGEMMAMLVLARTHGCGVLWG
jgi:hypothetical protein